MLRYRVAAPSIRIVPWAALASCWPLPQQLLPVSATGGGRRRCALAMFSGRIFEIWGSEKPAGFSEPLFSRKDFGNELPQSKPDGFDSSLGEGASGAQRLKGGFLNLPTKKLPRRVAGGAFIFLFKTRMRRPDMVRSQSYFRNFATARATMPPRMPDTRNSATPCTPTSSTTNMKGLAAPLTDTRFCT